MGNGILKESGRTTFIFFERAPRAGRVYASREAGSRLGLRPRSNSIARCAQRGQSAIETSLAFVVVIVLLAGMVRIWFWANNQIVERQLRFNASRVAAGGTGATNTNPYTLEDHWPVYTPPSLNEALWQAKEK